MLTLSFDHWGIAYMQRLRSIASNLLFVGLCGIGVLALAGSFTPRPRPPAPNPIDLQRISTEEFRAAVARVDAAFRAQWREQRVQPVGPADDLTLARRLSLALTGTVPSLEEVRAFEAVPHERRVDEYVARLLADRRHHDYFAERLARAYVGVKEGAFLVFRRTRLVIWLSEQLRDRRPYDAVVRDLITAEGVWTDHPEVNFVTGAIKPNQDNNQPDVNELTARLSRAFLGVRMDCAECHDHPFEPWKQGDFEGLAAFFGGTRMVPIQGIVDRTLEFKVEDRKTGETRVVAPRAPFDADHLPATGPQRARLAAWVTHHDNRPFHRAIVNRVWALMFGRGLADPVDDIRLADAVHPALDLLADDFADHGCDLARLIQMIAATEAFRHESRAADGAGVTAEQEAAWAAFPLTRLRPEQVVGGVEQSARLATLDYESNLLFRVMQVVEEDKFVERYGDAGEDELLDPGGTIPQRLLMMNGNLVHQKTSYVPLLNATTQIALLAPTDERAVEVAYLSVLTRRPTAAEAEYFVHELSGLRGRSHANRLADLCWALLNSTEFSWNH